VAFALTPARSSQTSVANLSGPAEFVRVQSIVRERCVICHTSAPVQGGMSAPPAGVRLDAPEFILLHTAKMRQQLASRAMPVGNVTGLTDEERAELLAWIERGAPH
jgi:uncharacterized membrane protein